MSDEFCARDAAIKKAKNEVNNYKGCFRWLYVLKISMESRLFILGVKKCDLIIAQNENQKRIISSNFDKNSFKLHNGHPIGNYNSRRKNDILYIGSLKSIKRPQLFCKLAKSLYGKPYTFIMIGANNFPDDKKKEMLSIIRESNVQYLGVQELCKVNTILSKSKLYINTSEYEGFPNTFIQSWMHGVPVLSFKVNPDNILTDNKLGMLCEDDIDKAKKVIENLMNNEKTWESYSKRCYDFAKEHFDIVKTIDKLEYRLNLLI